MTATLLRTLAIAATGITLVAAPALAQSSARPGPRETAIIRTMNDVYALMSKDVRTQVDAHLAKAKAALKAGDDDTYEKSLDDAMMLLAKELAHQPANAPSNG